METYSDFYKFFDELIIKGIFASVLFVIILKFTFKNLEITKTKNVLSWILIISALFSLIGTFGWLLFYEDVRNGMFKRATDKYWWAFWLMTISKLFVPLLLSKSKNRKKLYLLLFISIIMNIGWIFESFVIHYTSIHDDFVSPNYNPYSLNNLEIGRICNGVILGFTLIMVENLVFWFRKHNLNKTVHKSA
jgi:hypothetical protein